MLKGIANNTLLQMVLYQLVGQLVGSVITPYTQAITNQVNAATPLVPLSPADMALAVVRNVKDEAAAAREASFSGVDADRFRTLVQLTGDAPAAGDLAVALRRGLITQAEYERGVRQGRLRDEWAPLVKQLAVQEPSPTAMLNALLEGQIPEGEARRLYAELGGAPKYFDILFNTAGSAPTPLEAADMARRGIIGWSGRGPGVTSFEQAFLEGPWRNKWAPAFQAAAEYLPPPRTITAMFKEGSLSRAEAAALLTKQGLTPDLVAAYLRGGSATKTQPTKDLAQGVITSLYQDRLIKRPEALSMLGSLGYAADESDFILAVEDARLGQRFLSLAVGRVHSLYVAHKIDRTAVVNVLGKLGVEASGVSDLLAIWDWERTATVKSLSAAELAAAVKYKIIDVAEATRQLGAQGYTPHDAWVYLSIHNKGPLADEPPAGAVGPGPGP